MYKKVLFVFFSFISIAKADETFLSYGLGAGKSALNSQAETKQFDFGYREDLFQGISWQYKAGLWADGSFDPNRKTSGFASTGPQFTVSVLPLELRTGWGISGITTTDSYLGGHFQFNGEIYLGLRDNKGNGIGVEYQHFSSAGLETPNVGRDFVILQLSQKW